MCGHVCYLAKNYLMKWGKIFMQEAEKLITVCRKWYVI